MFTWVDILILIVIIFYALDGYRQGFWKILLDIVAVVISLFTALKFYPQIGDLFQNWGLASNLSKPVGFFALWMVMQIIFYLLAILIFHYFPKYSEGKKIGKILGIFPGIIKGLMIVAILLIILITLPLGTSFKNILSNSLIAGPLIKSTARIEGQIVKIFGQLNNSFTFLTVSPEDTEEASRLNFQTNDFSIDAVDEEKMVSLVNNERQKAGLAPLTTDLLLRNVARSHSMDMLRNGYFAHKSPSGEMPYDRLIAAGANFRLVGENLALAPSVDLAHIGLMNSPSHRENILDPNFKRIGIGIIDADPYGKMITQVFTD